MVVLFVLSCPQGLSQYSVVFSFSPCHVLVFVHVLCLFCRLYFGFVDLVVVRLGVLHLQRLIREPFLLLLFLLLWSSSHYAAQNFVVNSFCCVTFSLLLLMNIPFRPVCTFFTLSCNLRRCSCCSFNCFPS